jgi:FAD:protein FMN transferase
MCRELTSGAFPAMGAEVEYQLAGSREDADATRGRLARLFAQYEAVMSRFLPDSELSALNASSGSPFAASPRLFDVVAEAAGWACVTGGAFDPTLLDALESAGYDRTFAEVGGGGGVAVAARTGVCSGRWRDIAFEFERDTITLPAGVRIDLGGIGKGYTVDRAIESLPPDASAMVNAGGDLYASGAGPEGGGWIVGIGDPSEPERDLAAICVRDRGVATSGSSKRCWRSGDRRYHHLIDPRTGESSDNDLAAVTVIAPSATAADVLAKTAFLLGAGAGPRFIEGIAPCACLAVTLRGDVLVTERFREYLL